MHHGSSSCDRPKDQISKCLRRFRSCDQSDQRRVDTKHPNLIPYRECVLTLIPHFTEITFEHFPREENQLADALATVSSMFKVKWDNEAPRIIIWKLDEPAYCCDLETELVNEKPWYHEVKRYLEAQEYPEGASVKIGRAHV